MKILCKIFGHKVKNTLVSQIDLAYSTEYHKINAVTTPEMFRRFPDHDKINQYQARCERCLEEKVGTLASYINN